MQSRPTDHEASKRTGARLALVAVVVLAWAPGFAADAYEIQRAEAVRVCSAVAAEDYQSGLWLNPDGYRSYYERSRCFQEAAVRFRDGGLCGQVRRRRALLSSSWGYSEANCRELVAEGIAADRSELVARRAAYQRAGVRLTALRIVRNGNGRDYDLLPEFSGNGGGGHRLTLQLQPPDGSPVLIHEDGYHVSGADSRLRIYLPASDIRARYPAFAGDVAYQLIATLEFSIGHGSQGGLWSSAFIEAEFPAAERRHSLTRRVVFGDLTFTPEPVGP